MKTAQQNLEMQVADMQDHNRTLTQQIEEQRKEIESMMRGLENMVGDLEGSAAALNAKRDI